MAQMVINIFLIISGLFTLALGTLHFGLPLLLDFKQAIPTDGPPLKPLRLPFVRYQTRRADVYGITWVMNHAASYTLVTIGVLDLFWRQWLALPLGRGLAWWIGGWWVLRAATQFYLGRRRGDWYIAIGFAVLGVVHAIAALL